MDINSIKDKIKTGAYDLSEHAHKERQEEQITISEIEQTIAEGGILEQYPNDPRGESCLVVGKVTKQEQRSLKAVAKCYFCKGKTRIKKVDIDFRWGKRLFVVKNAPVEVCSQCGERYYSAKISKKLDELVEKQVAQKVKPQKIIEVPVFNWQ